MSISSIIILEKNYFSDRDLFLKNIKENTSQGQFYKSLISEITSEISNIYSSMSNSTVAQIDMDGNVIFASPDANFGNTKKEILKTRGTIQKIGDKYILVSDTKNKQAIIWKIGFLNISEIIGGENILPEEILFFNDVFSDINNAIGTYDTYWSYKSDRFVTSFNLIKGIPEILVTENYEELLPIAVNYGNEISWTNKTQETIKIYSGYTTYDNFYLNPDFNLYGKDFKNEEILPGETWKIKIDGFGEFNWFAYPFIKTGKIIVTQNEIQKYDSFLICENDGLDVPFTSRVIKVDYNSNVIWSFGEGYLVNPQKAIELKNGNILVNT